MDNYFMKKPCARCPYRKDVKPYLHPDRGIELALNAVTKADFICHKTLNYNLQEYNDETEEDELTPEAYANQKLCAGMLTLRASEGRSDVVEEFVPSYDLCYKYISEMIAAYADVKVGKR